MTGAFAGRDSHEVDALVTDRYLEALLAAHARGADRGPAPAAPDDTIRRTADRLARDLPRFHPSFLFEEALAARLSEVAARLRDPVTADGFLLPLPGHGLLSDDLDGPAGTPWPAFGRRPLLIGGAVTSAAISLAGAAYVAWRRNHPSASPMVRAARAVARTRPV